MVKGKGKKGKGKGKIEKSKGQGEERRCFYSDGKGHITPNCLQKVIDDKKKSDPKSSSSIDNVMPVTMAPTAREHESSDELWIFAIAVGGSLGCGIGVPNELVETDGRQWCCCEDNVYTGGSKAETL